MVSLLKVWTGGNLLTALFFLIAACVTTAPPGPQGTRPESGGADYAAREPAAGALTSPLPPSPRVEAVPSSDTPSHAKDKQAQAAAACPPSPSNAPEPPPAPAPSNQEMLDSALEFCQASYEFWERGDLNNAIDALDQAYSLILQVDPEGDPEILQQRDDLRITISKRIMEVYASRYTVANGNGKAIPLVMNAHVKKALKLFRGKERKFFLAAYKRSGKYRPAIVEALKEAGLPEELSWLPLIESGYKTHALSRARALGLWQFIASTGYKFGLRRDRWIDERMDPEKSTTAAIAYLKELHQIFGDWETALAAYNCGEGRVLRVIRSQRINYLDNFWDLYEKLPIETAFYVPKFIAVLHIVSDPETHGFTLPPVHPQREVEKVTINKQVHLKTVASRLDLSFQDLQELNPELRRNSTPNRPYVLNVPPGEGPVLRAELDDIPVWRPPVPQFEWHRVRRGESLSTIARRNRTSVRAIMALNGLTSSHYIRAGWKLKIPTNRRYVSARPSSSSRRAASSAGKVSQYVVRKGDSLWRIANRFGTTTEAIQTLNHLNTTRLQIGQVLKIPQERSGGQDIPTSKYRVCKGDSPFEIAKRHNMNLSQFLRLNHLTPRSTIYPGQVLLVKAQ